MTPAIGVMGRVAVKVAGPYKPAFPPVSKTEPRFALKVKEVPVSVVDLVATYL
jgi:hypothetical protein